MSWAHEGCARRWIAGGFTLIEGEILSQTPLALWRRAFLPLRAATVHGDCAGRHRGAGAALP